MNLEDVPRSANFKVGDTIVTGSNSLIFPEGLPIGFVKSFDLEGNTGYYNIKTKLFADMTNLNQAYIIIPENIKEAQKLLDRDE
jgi:rod shape-determining protein MreC